MARISCCGLVRRSIAFMSLLAIVLILAAPVALLVSFLVFVFKTPTNSLTTGGLLGPTYSLAWQEPFSYEAKVYASLSPDVLSDMDHFFENAQLLWHIEPQSIGKRYPAFRNRVRVNIPSQLRSNPSHHQILYAHMFIQKAGQFNPHPDFSDAHLVSSKIPLVQWSNIASKIVDNKSLLEPNREQAWELLGTNCAAWAIVLENNVYSLNDIPSYLQVTYESSNTAMYNPPLLPNTFTKVQPKGQPVASLKDKQLSADVYQQFIDVELELSGIRQGWVLAKTKFVGYLGSNNAVPIQKTIPDSSNPEQYKTPNRVAWAQGENLDTFNRGKHVSVPLIFYIVLSIALACAQFPAYIWLILRLLSTPVTRWIGVSRATIVIMLSAQMLRALSAIAKYGIIGIVVVIFTPGLAITVFIAASLDEMSFAPWVVLSRLFRKIFRYKNSPNVARSSTQQLVLTAEVKSKSMAERSRMINSYFRRSEPIIAIRRSVDQVAMRWIHLLSIPTIAVIALYVLILRDDLLLSLGFVGSVVTVSSQVFFFVAWLPQIIVNYRAKSGSLTPVTYNFLVLGNSVLLAVLGYLTGYNNAMKIMMCIPVNVCHVIIVLQRIMYFIKPKHE